MSNSLYITGDCSEAISEIKSSSSENNWVLFGYNGRTNEIKVDEKGSGGLEEFAENLNDGRIEFGYLRFDINQTQKFLFVSWCGGGVDGIRKGFFNNHTKEFENWLGQGGRGFHLQINARNEDDLDPKIVLDKLNKVSSFIRATSLKSAAQDKDKAKAQSSQYWQQEKQVDAQRKEALTAHQQQQQQNLAAVKDQEQRRLGQQAKETMSSMEQQRQANVQQYQRQEQERTQVQTKLQEDKRAQILGEQARNKQSSYVAADYSHDVKVQPPAPGPRAAYKAAPSPAAAAPPPVKQAPGRLASPAAFNQPPPAAAPKPGPAKPFKPAPPPVSSRTPAKPAAPAPPAPVYHAPEPAYEEPQQTYEETYEEPQQTYEDQSYQDQSYQDQSYQEQAYEEPAQEAYHEPAQEEYQDQSYQEQAYEEPAQEAYQEPAQEEYQEQAYDDGGYQQGYAQAKALYDYAAEAATDLSFAEGDIINILEDQDPSGWWKGELNGAEGYFPMNFVERI